jgi:hypothetical protein
MRNFNIGIFRSPACIVPPPITNNHIRHARTNVALHESAPHCPAKVRASEPSLPPSQLPGHSRIPGMATRSAPTVQRTEPATKPVTKTFANTGSGYEKHPPLPREGPRQRTEPATKPVTRTFANTGSGYEEQPPQGPEGTLLCVEGQCGGCDEVDAPVFAKD